MPLPLTKARFLNLNSDGLKTKTDYATQLTTEHINLRPFDQTYALTYIFFVFISFLFFRFCGLPK